MNEQETPEPFQSDSASTTGRRVVEVRIPIQVGESVDIAFPEGHEIVGYYICVEMTRIQIGNGQQRGLIMPVAVILADLSLPETETRRFFLAGVGTVVPDDAEPLDCLACPTSRGMRPAILCELPVS